MLALSTAWNAKRYNSGRKIIEEIKRLGFYSVELNFSLTKSIIKDISQSKDIRIVSLHNFCPIPDRLSRNQSLPDVYSLSSPIKNIRKKALKFTKRTIITAKNLNAHVAVIHMGRVEIPDYTKQLIDIARSQKQQSSKFKKLKEKMISERRNNAAEFFDCAFQSLRELSCFAHDEGIKLGIENRFYYREIPNFKEMKVFLDNFSKKNTRYWHDTGHAHIQEKLGFDKVSDILKEFSKNLIGMHLHDVRNLSDHKAPFFGEIDFIALKKFTTKKTLKVVEVHHPTTEREIIFSKNKLEEIFN